MYWAATTRDPLFTDDFINHCRKNEQQFDATSSVNTRPFHSTSSKHFFENHPGDEDVRTNPVLCPGFHGANSFTGEFFSVNGPLRPRLWSLQSIDSRSSSGPFIFGSVPGCTNDPGRAGVTRVFCKIDSPGRRSPRLKSPSRFGQCDTLRRIQSDDTLFHAVPSWITLTTLRA